MLIFRPDYTVTSNDLIQAISLFSGQSENGTEVEDGRGETAFRRREERLKRTREEEITLR